VPDLPAPPPPSAAVAVRERVEEVLARHAAVATWRHEDRFWESDDGRRTVQGWGTTVQPRGAGGRIEIWFDALDGDLAIALDRPRRRWWPTRKADYQGWVDFTDLGRVLSELEARLVGYLASYEPPRDALRRD
jgi:hypothetical protein